MLSVESAELLSEWCARAKREGRINVNIVGGEALMGGRVPVREKTVEAWGSNPLYAKLGEVFAAAYEQASAGKGKERHAEDDEAFEDQQICEINRMLGSFDGSLFQGIKKAVESKKLLQIKGKDAATMELLGAINYLASAIILLDEMGEND